MERVLKSSSAEEYTLFGHCMGGTISAVYASLFPEKRKNLILLATPINFAPEDPGNWDSGRSLVGAAKASSTRTC